MKNKSQIKPKSETTQELTNTAANVLRKMENERKNFNWKHEIKMFFIKQQNKHLQRKKIEYVGKWAPEEESKATF